MCVVVSVAVSVFVARLLTGIDRDLIKWCKRVCRSTQSLRGDHTAITNTVKELIFTEAVDCFAGAIANDTLRKAVINKIAVVWGITAERIHYYATMHKPGFQVTTSTVSIGRVTLPQIVVCRTCLHNDNSSDY
jgi:midasin